MPKGSVIAQLQERIERLAAPRRERGAWRRCAPFAAGIAARMRGKVLWCLTRDELFAPSLSQVGLSATLECGDDKTPPGLTTSTAGMMVVRGKIQREGRWSIS